ncbi:MAG: AAA family ATPase, partial [Desulfovibrionales bacterium]
MPKTLPLRPERLHPRKAELAVDVESSSDIRTSPPLPTQPRALQALELALLVRDNEHNVFLSGNAGLGRTYFVCKFLAPEAEVRQTPPDLIYLHNFDNPDRPQAVALPAGLGKQFQKDLREAIHEMQKAVPEQFSQEHYLTKRERLIQGFTASRADLLEKMEKRAASSGFSLNMDDQGTLALNPLLEGKNASLEEFDRLPAPRRKKIKQQSSRVMKSVMEILRQLDQEETELERRKQSLDSSELTKVLERIFAPLQDKYTEHKPLADHLNRVVEDILDHVEIFQPGEEERAEESDQREELFKRFKANLFVDNSGISGAPVIIEDNPSFFNLLGCIERETEMGTMHTDFSLLRAGSLHRANGGFLILKAEQLLANPQSWEG